MLLSYFPKMHLGEQYSQRPLISTHSIQLFTCFFMHSIFNYFSLFFPSRFVGDILLRVNYAVSKQNKFVEKYGSVYQIPSPAFTLTRKLYFFRTATRFNLTNPFAIHQLNLDHCPTARLPNDSLTTNDRDKTDTVPGSTMHSTT